MKLTHCNFESDSHTAHTPTLTTSTGKCTQQNTNHKHIAPLEEQCHNSKNAHFELYPQEVCLRPYLPSGIASHVYFLNWPREGRSVVLLLMRLHRPASCSSSLQKSCIFGVVTVFFQGWDIINSVL
jgi:hypothetical protein